MPKVIELQSAGSCFDPHLVSNLACTTQGKVEGEIRLGCKTISWLQIIRKWTGLTVEELFRIASDRERLKELVDSVA